MKLFRLILWVNKFLFGNTSQLCGFKVQMVLKMKKKIIQPLFLAVMFSMACYAGLAQDTLPKFTIREIGSSKVLISWTNPFPNCVQLAVQRSFDSTRYFSTVFSAISPDLPQNGFADNKMPAGIKAFYRIFYVLEGGAYFFSKSQSIGVVKREMQAELAPENDIPKNTDSKKLIKIYNRDKPKDVLEIDYSRYKKFRDSIISKTRDSIYVLSADAIMLKPYIVRPFWKPSTYIYTTTKGYVDLHFPLAKQRKYKVIFYDESGTELFTIKQIKEPSLTLDYTNFIHAGWFNFELFEDDKLKEKGRFLLQKLF
jgi:hypothetical protein